jgi:hypothetical protein
MAISYTNEHMLKDHGDRFVCVLFHLARGIKDRGFNSDKILMYLNGDDNKVRKTVVKYAYPIVVICSYMLMTIVFHVLRD